MKTLYSAMAGAVIGAGAVMLITGLQQDASKLTSQRQAAERPVVSVLAGKIAAAKIPRVHVAAGQVSADQTIELSSRISGYISRLLPAEGAIVEAGELLVEIDAAAVESSIRQARASLQEALSELSDARADVTRFTGLVNTHAISGERLRKAKLRETRASTAVDSAGAELAEYRAELAYTQIKSPVRARIIEHLSKPGDLAVPGTSILRIESLSTPHFETWVPISIIEQLAIGEEVALSLDGQSAAIKSIITELVRSADPVTRRCKVRLGLPEKVTTLVGHYGHADFLLGSDTRPVVTEKALIQRAGIFGVFIIDQDNFARFRSIRAGRRWQDKIELLAGPAIGQRTILNPVGSLRDGDPVEPLPVP